MSEQEVRVRVAPSPTGDPHVGTAYISLFNWMFAKKHGGKFILRIEDTDQDRCSKESEQMIFETLKWLGLDYDEGPDVGGDYGPYRQSERLDHYKKAADTLIEKGHAYRCFCSKTRLEELKVLQRKLKKPSGYDGHCRYLSKEEEQSKINTGESYVVRLKVNKEGNTRFKDWLRDDIVIENKEVDDQVILKSDGFPTYHLANVVDDHLMKITHVIRAEEWIVSVPKHIMLYDALGWKAPEFIHMPLLRNADRSKISKRKNPVSLHWYRDAGYLPEALINFLALLGWSLGEDREIFSREDMLKEFDIKRVSVAGPVFNLEKLDWLNGCYIRSMPINELHHILKKWMKSDQQLTESQLKNLLPLVQDRLKRLDQWEKLTEYFFPVVLNMDPEFLRVRKKNKATGPETHSPQESSELLEALAKHLENLDNWEESALESSIKEYIATLDGWKAAEVYMLIRKATTGTTESPPLYPTIQIIGREVCLERWRYVAGILKKLKLAEAIENL